MAASSVKNTGATGFCAQLAFKATSRLRAVELEGLAALASWTAAFEGEVDAFEQAGFEVTR